MNRESLFRRSPLERVFFVLIQAFYNDVVPSLSYYIVGDNTGLS